MKIAIVRLTDKNRTVQNLLQILFIHKQASDDEDNEIEIVEPKTDLITLDSDDDETTPSSPSKPSQPLAQSTTQSLFSGPKHITEVKIKAGTSPIPVVQTKPTTVPAAAPLRTPHAEDNMDLMSMAQSFLASMLEVEIQEGPLNSPGSDSSGQKKQPRKKLTNKPNPTLLKQKALMERERLEEMKRNDQKLKMKCSVELKKAEEVFPYAKEMLEARAKEKLELDEEEEHDDNKKEEHDEVTSTATIGEDNTNEKSKMETDSLNGLSAENCKSTKRNNQLIKLLTEDTDNANLCSKTLKKVTENVTFQGKISEKEKPLLETPEKSVTDEKQDEETKSCNGRDNETEEHVNNSDAAMLTKEKHLNNEEELLGNADKNLPKTDDEQHNSNSSLNSGSGRNLAESMEIEESPPDTAKVESMEIDETEPSEKQTVETPELEPEISKTELNELKATKTDQEVKTVAIESNHNSEQQLENTELVLARKDAEHAIISNKENGVDGSDADKGKGSPALIEDLVSKPPTSDTLLTDSSTLLSTSSSNGNV